MYSLRCLFFLFSPKLGPGAAVPFKARLLEALLAIIFGALAASHAFSTPESAATMTAAPAEKTFEALAFVPNATAIGLGFVESALTQAQVHLALQLGNLLSFNVTAFKDGARPSCL